MDLHSPLERVRQGVVLVYLSIARWYLVMPMLSMGKGESKPAGNKECRIKAQFYNIHTKEKGTCKTKVGGSSPPGNTNVYQYRRRAGFGRTGIIGDVSPAIPYAIKGSMEKVSRPTLWRRGESECLIVKYPIQRVSRATKKPGMPMAMATTTSTESEDFSAIDSQSCYIVRAVWVFVICVAVVGRC